MRWSPRVPAHKVRRLYESDAQGMLDEELLDEVGYGILARCHDIVDVSEAEKGRVKCRNCGHTIVRREGERTSFVGHGDVLTGGKGEVLRCERCAWETTWGEYVRSLSGRNLHDGGVVHLFRAFGERWPAARSAQAKLLLIDSLIHEFHVVQKGLGRPVAVNVIEGTAREVAALLDGLACGAGSTAGLTETRAGWRRRLGQDA